MIQDLMRGKYTAQHEKDAGQFASKNNLSAASGDFKAGDIIEFWGGYNNDLRYRSKIFGFNKEGGIYVIWDCYWFPIKDDKARNIKKINAKEAA